MPSIDCTDTIEYPTTHPQHIWIMESMTTDMNHESEIFGGRTHHHHLHARSMNIKVVARLLFEDLSDKLCTRMSHHRDRMEGGRTTEGLQTGLNSDRRITVIT
ncbi:unnamed protein product [Mortierella alpina]